METMETPVQQGSDAWKQLRLGMVTASRFKDMMTNGRGKDTMGQTAYTYMYDLIAERLTGQPQDEINVRALQWGNDTEPQARAMYCLVRDVRVKQVAFVRHSGEADWCKQIGGSPDGLIDDDDDGPGGVEIKCPSNSRIHLRYLENGGVPSDYKMQVQGLMWVTGRTWWDFVSFDPRMPRELQLFVHREIMDRDVHEELEDRAKRFVDQMLIKLNKIRQGVLS